MVCLQVKWLQFKLVVWGANHIISFLQSTSWQMSNIIIISLFISRFIYCNSTSKRQTSIIYGPDPKGPCGQSELMRLVSGRN